MINLISKKEKEKIVANFYRRLLVLFLLMFSFVIFIAIMAILPAYFYSSVKDSIVDTKLKAEQDEGTPVLGDQTLSTMKDMNQKLSLVENAEKNKFSISEKVVNAILAEKTSNIKIIQITYKNDPVLGKQVNILGTASSRDALLLFQQILANDPDFTNVNLPISSFVKESNIPFNLSLSPS